MSIIINHISYLHSDKETLFENISFSVDKNETVALIGNNGVGKSTLLKILAGQLQASSGEVTATQPYYIPQHFGQYDNLTIAQILHVDEKIKALHAILSGDASDKNFTLLDDDWTIEDKVSAAFSQWKITHLSLSQSMKELSGGEKTKVFLSGIAIHAPSVILLDEPSNHLDKDGRTQLYKFVKTEKASMIVVSHDRTLLNLLNVTYELQRNNIIAYGGNYEFYKKQKAGEVNALQEQLGEQEKALRLARKSARETAERKQKHESRGKKQNIKGGIPRIAIKTLKDNAEKSSSRLAKAHTEKMETMKDAIKQTHNKLPDVKGLMLQLENANLHKGKTLIDAQSINFKHDKSFLWENPLSFHVRSGDKIVISGENGAGKTTLLRMLLGKIAPSVGAIKCSPFHYLYLDQQYEIINNQCTVFEQVQNHNERNLQEHELKTLLHRFLFPAQSWDKTCDKLSGGEKMKLTFCSLIVSNQTPDVVALDEPTNNLDVESLEIITATIKEYQGTVFLISHDQYFIDEIGIEQCWELEAES